MDKLATILSTVAVIGVAWVAFGQDRPPGANEDIVARLDQIQADQKALRKELAHLEEARPPEFVSGGGGMAPVDETADGPVLRAAPPSATGLAEVERPVAERLAALEARVKQQDDEVAALKKKGPTRFTPFGNKKFFRSPDDAAKALEMSDAQKSDMERTLTNAKSELERLYDTQNEDGVTLNEIQKEMSEKIKKGEMGDVLSYVGKMSKFKAGKIPGSNETFREAERRIHKNAMAEIREDLDPKQQKEWDNAHTGALLPGAGPATTMSTVVMDGDGADGAFFGGIEVK